MAVDPAVQEKAHAAEHRVALVRWAVVTFNSVVYIFLLDKAQVIPSLAWTIIVVAQIYALYVIFQRPYERYPVMRSATFTSLTDMSLIALWVLGTGNWYSPFYVVWYISIVAIAFRFSFQRTLAVATLYSGAYVGVLALGGQLFLDPGALGVRVGYIFLVGWLAGLIGEETYAQTREKLAMRELAEASAGITEQLDVETIARRVVGSATDLLDAQRGALFLLDAETEEVSCAYATGLSEAYLQAVMAGYRDLPASGLLGGQASVRVDDLRTDPRTQQISGAATREGVASALAVPLAIYGEPFGALLLYRDEVAPFDGEEVGLARSLASHAAIALENAQLVDELRSSESRWRSLVRNAPNIIMMVDQEGKLQFVNRTVGDLPHEQVLGTSVYDWVAPSYQALMRETVEGVFETGEPGSYEVPGPGEEGEERWYHTRVGPLEVEGEVQAALLISLDITDRRRAEEELRRSNADLEQFAYVASHDLQEPLRMVTSYVQLLQKRYQGQLDEEADEFIGYAVEGSTRMRQLIQDLLIYSQVNSGDLGVEAVDLNDVLDTVLKDLAPQLEETGAEVDVGDLPVLQGDAGLLGQLFSNLLSNAVKFQDGSHPVVRVTATQADGAWAIDVEDNGIGIEPDHRERIFQLFQRLHKRSRYPGTGIGLSICRRIVERHGGEVTVEASEDLGGSRFQVTLPSR